MGWFSRLVQLTCKYWSLLPLTAYFPLHFLKYLRAANSQKEPCHWQHQLRIPPTTYSVGHPELFKSTSMSHI
ncbi:hypothetical protein IF1G_11268 [Cordyceps javanica]|uniref:Uncharacterized protein n=1 Tax=Cordyceps javanica TaxID=43265 RepID=A0A545UKS5_9HYPO|nr:hypothetical protein IF1G_11268 [Cordyceps javanica]